ncbi:Hypothetical predicted protein, partial [Marmota monax]
GISTENMEKDNATSLTVFVLTGLIHQPQWKLPLFLLFLVIFLITLVGNLGLNTLIWKDPQLHIPMYLFLGSLAFVDASISSTVIPKMLVNFLAKNKFISLFECMVQFFSFNISATTECFLLAAMAYDRYAAICKPLLYPVIMTNRLCINLLVLSFGTSREDMEKKNVTLLTEFVLTGLIDGQGLKVPLFLLFLMIYLITIVGNLGLIALIWNDPHLHIPMYLFLGSLAFVDAWISSTVTPNMLVNLLAKSKSISLSECMVQFFAFAFGGTTECFLLGTMAYDRYVAICKPLLYLVIMTNRLCIRLLVLSF